MAGEDRAQAVADAMARAAGWHRHAALLARLPDSVTGGLISRRLVDDLGLLAGGGPRPGAYALRVAVLWSPGGLDSGLVEALLATRLPGLSRILDDRTFRHTNWHCPLRIAAFSPAGAEDAEPRLILSPDATAQWHILDDRIAAWLRVQPALPAHLAALRQLLANSGPGRLGPAKVAGGIDGQTGYRGYAQVDAVLRRMAVLREVASQADPGAGHPDACAPAELHVAASDRGQCWTEAPVTLCLLPVADPHGAQEAGWEYSSMVRRELAGAHAVLGVAGYEDIVGRTPQRPAHLAYLGEWLRFAAEQVGPDRITVAVDGIGRSRSAAGNTSDWVRQEARARLALPDSLTPESIVPVSGDLAAAAGPEEPAQEDWVASGLPSLQARITGPLIRDPEADFTLAVVRELTGACSQISQRCQEILKLELAVAQQLGLPVTRAAHRRARLGAIAGGPVAARIAAAVAG